MEFALEFGESHLSNLLTLAHLYSAECWHGGVDAGADAGGPAGGDGLEAGVEADAFGAVDVVVAEEGTLPSAEGVEGHGHGDGDVDADHAGLHAAAEVAGGVAVAGEDAAAVAVLVLVDEFEGLLEVVDADDAEDGAEDLFLVNTHLGLDVVEERGAEEEAVGGVWRGLGLAIQF